MPVPFESTSGLQYLSSPFIEAESAANIAFSDPGKDSLAVGRGAWFIVVIPKLLTPCSPRFPAPVSTIIIHNHLCCRGYQILHSPSDIHTFKGVSVFLSPEAPFARPLLFLRSIVVHLTASPSPCDELLQPTADTLVIAVTRFLPHHAYLLFTLTLRGV